MQSEKKINWAILVTGWGRNAKDTITAFNEGKIKKSTVKLLIYEEEPCGAKETAEKYNIDTIKILKTDFSSLIAYQKELIKVLKLKEIDYVFLLNYKYIIKKDMLNAFPDKILNIHPSLFPSFLATKTAIQDALNYGVKVTGITTHIIDDKIDEGNIICQKAIKVKDRTFDELYPVFAKQGKKIIIKSIKQMERNHFNT